ncbi:MAG: DUF3368 domain-containing protein [Candidatus Latescibacteria bacterium]|nr:DUF3368 domain-containing protein [Candidatus Latescibacterota bacterium]
MNRIRNLSEDIRSRAAKKPKVISDSGPLISLGILQRFDVLQELFGEIYIPEAVYEEVVVSGCGRPGAEETRAAADQGWLQRVRVVNRTAVEVLLEELDIGEAEVLVLAKEVKAGYVLLDDCAARERASLLGLNVTGTIGVLRLAVAEGLSVDLKEALDILIDRNFRISKELYKRVLGG